MPTNADLTTYGDLLSGFTVDEVMELIEEKTSVLDFLPTQRMAGRLTKTRIREEAPLAGWVSTRDEEGVRGERRKPYVKFTWGNGELVAEEVAFVAAIPEEDFDDAEFDLEADLLASGGQSLLKTLNNAVLVGASSVSGSPFTSDGIVDGATLASQTVTASGDLAADVLQAITSFESTGLKATRLIVAGSAAAFVNSGTNFNTPVLTSANGVDRVWGLPVTWVDSDALGGALVAVIDERGYRVGIRQDLKFKFDPSGTIVKKSGSDALTANDIISGLNDDIIAFRGKGRFGFRAASVNGVYPAYVVTVDESI